MKVLLLNSVSGFGSTGRICTDIASNLEKKGFEYLIVYGRGESPVQFNSIKIGGNINNYTHVLKTRIFDNHGFNSKRQTLKLVKLIEDYNPDVIHLHNLHGYYLNLSVLFEYLKKSNKKIIWTLHDCWPFTGHCAYYTFIDCSKWKNQCHDCQNKREYPKSILFDNSIKNYKIKKELLTNINNLTIVTPSKWLAGEVKESFLKEYPIKVINNGINTNIFKYTDSNLRSNYKLENKYIILGVASKWENRKGIRDFYELRKKLDDRFHIVLIGIDEKQIGDLPDGILGIKRTNSINELVEWYSTADVYFNPTYEDNYPTTNLESIACGTPVITYKTGGSPESMFGIGKVINNINEFIILEKNGFELIDYEQIDINSMVESYIKLYIE